MTNIIIVLLTVIIMAYVVLPWLERKLTAWMMKTDGTADADRLNSVVGLAAIGLVLVALQMIMWGTQLLAYIVHMFV